MRFLVGFGLFLLTLLAGAVAALYVFRVPLAQRALTQSLSHAGFDAPSLNVAALDLNTLRIEALSLGAPADDSGLSLDLVEVTYDWRDLLKGRVQSITIGPGAVRVDRVDGGFELAGMRFAPQPGVEAQSAPFGWASFKAPFDALSIEPVTVAIFDGHSDDLMARGALSGALRPDEGGAFKFNAAAPNFAQGGFAIKDGTAEFRVSFDQTGYASLSGQVKSAALSLVEGKGEGAGKGAAGIILREALIDVAGSGNDWRRFFVEEEYTEGLAGKAELHWRQGYLERRDTPSLAVVSEVEAEAFSLLKPIDRVDLYGGVALAYKGGVFTAAPFKNGEPRLILRRASWQEASNDEDREEIRLMPVRAVAGAGAGADAGDDDIGAPFISWPIMAAGEGEAAPANPSFAGALVVDTKGLKGRFGLDGAWQGGDLDTDIMMEARAPQIMAAGAKLEDLAAEGALTLKFSAQDQTLLIAAHEKACLRLDLARFSLGEQNGSLKDIKFCETGQPFLDLALGAEPKALYGGRLSGEGVSYKAGEFAALGAPPWIDLKGDYHLGTAPAGTVEGRLGGGRVAINDILLAEGFTGSFNGALSGGALRAYGTVDRVNLREKSDAPLTAPMIGQGTFRLKQEIFTADYQLKTASGFALGGGAMTHHLNTGIGAADYKTGALFFIPGGAQPDQIAPVLKGFISAAVGSLEAAANFAWSQSQAAAFTSSGKIIFNDLSFRGPGVAVSRTSGINGVLSFDSLAPIKTADEQLMTIKAVDLGALVLEEGEVRFSLPGDDTLQLTSASFPWFGGVIGAYDSAVSLSDGRAEIILKASDVDLAAVLDYAKISGLSGEAKLKGTLPLIFENNEARIEGGRLDAVGPGVIRYAGQTTDAAAAANPQAKFALDILRNLKFEKLSAVIDGPLDGNLQFQLFFEGTNDISAPGDQNVDIPSAPIVYRISIDAPVLALLENARQSTDYKQRIEQVKRLRARQEAGE